MKQGLAWLAVGAGLLMVALCLSSVGWISTALGLAGTVILGIGTGHLTERRRS